MDAKNSSPPRLLKKDDENQEPAVFESPSRASTSRPPIPSTPGGMTVKPPSTPGHAVYGFAPGTPRASQNIGHMSLGSSKIIAELNTPVISNANVTYVDDEPKDGGRGVGRGAHPNLGLPAGRAFGIDKSTSYGISKSLAPRTNTMSCPQPFLRQQQGTLGVMNSLAMPSGLYSDDSSLDEDVAKVEEKQGNRPGPASSILRPIELKPNTRFHSFQGSSQYERSIPKSTARPTSTLPPAQEETVGLGNTFTVSGQRQQQQYLPTIRGAHGVRELSDTKDLDAIFKAERNTSSGTSHAHPKSPKIVSPMSVDNDSETEDEEQRQEPCFPQLPGAIPIDDRQWSIPSIRLANHVDTSGMDGSVHSYHTLFSDEEDYTDDGGSSLDGSYIGCDDDDVSLSSKESYDQVRRWRRLSGALRRGMSGDGIATARPAAARGDDEDVDMVPPPHVMRTSPTSDLNAVASKDLTPGTAQATSLLEQRFGQINIGPIDSNNSSIYGPPPILNITATPKSIDDNAFDYHKDEHGRQVRARPSKSRRRHKKKGRSQSHSASAFEWINQLQQTNAVEGGLITEAASSKFLTGNKGNTVECADLAVEQDVTKALGMPHPLCRSSTIEAGGFAYGIGGGVGSG